MKYLYRPGPQEELTVQGLYITEQSDGMDTLTERWERYRITGVEEQVWRAEWHHTNPTWEDGGMLAHVVVSNNGVERLVLRATVAGKSSTLTVTTESNGLLISHGETVEEINLPPVYGLVTPFKSLSRLRIPFDLAFDDKEVAMTYRLIPNVRPLASGGVEWKHRPVKFGYFPLGLRDFTVKGQDVKGKGWRMEVPGLHSNNLWFDRHGTLLYAETDAMPSLTTTLVEWRTFG